jgi:hypothetical protein
MSRMLSVGLLAGCASGAGWWIFEEPGVTETQLKLDQNECFARSIDGTNPNSGGVVGVSRDAYRRCWRSEGYRVSREPELTRA